MRWKNGIATLVANLVSLLPADGGALLRLVHEIVDDHLSRTWEACGMDKITEIKTETTYFVESCETARHYDNT